MHVDFIVGVHLLFYAFNQEGYLMKAYVNRLMQCGYSRQKAQEICEQFVRNLTLIDLDFFVLTMELKYVG